MIGSGYPGKSAVSPGSYAKVIQLFCEVCEKLIFFSQTTQKVVFEGKMIGSGYPGKSAVSPGSYAKVIQLFCEVCVFCEKNKK